MTVMYSEDEYRARFLDPVTKIVRRVEIYEADGRTLWEGAGTDPRLISGSVSVDYSRAERRSLDLSLANFDKALIHQPEGFWYDKVLQVYRGITFRDTSGAEQTKEYSLGKFLIDRVSQPRFPDIVKVTARDFTKKCMLSKFVTTTAFTKNTNIKTILDALAANSGIYDRIIPVTSEVLGTDIVFERGMSRWDAMKQIADAFSYEIFFDAHGYLVVRKYLDPTTSPVAHEFLTGPKVGNLVDWEKSTNDTRIYNWVSVQGMTDAGLPVRADAINTNPNSPTNVDRIGPRVLLFDSEIITSEAQAQELGTSLLRVNSLEEYEINMTSIVTPWLEAGEIARFVDPEASPNDPDRFLLTSFTAPIGLEPMSAVGRRVTIVE